MEALSQLHLLPTTRKPKILACAPSNAAADAIAIKLSSHLSKSQLLRLNAPTREWAALTPDQQDFHRNYSFWVDGEGGKRFVIPEKQQLETFEVVVSTCVSGGIPAALGVKRGHFKWVFIDEAGQASEPEGTKVLLHRMCFFCRTDSF